MKPTTLSAKSRDGILRPGEEVVQHSSFGHLATSRSILSIKTYELSQWQMADLVESNTQRKQVWQSRMCLTSSVMIHPQALPLQKACAWDWRGPGSIPSTTLTITSVEVTSTPPPLNTVSRAPLCSPESPDSLLIDFRQIEILFPWLHQTPFGFASTTDRATFHLACH